MINSELLLTLLITLIVFGPKKLPLLATQLGKFLQYILNLKKKALVFIEAQQNEIQLLENKKKADEADKYYNKKHES